MISPLALRVFSLPNSYSNQHFSYLSSDLEFQMPTLRYNFYWNDFKFSIFKSMFSAVTSSYIHADLIFVLLFSSQFCVILKKFNVGYFVRVWWTEMLFIQVGLSVSVIGIAQKCSMGKQLIVLNSYPLVFPSLSDLDPGKDLFYRKYPSFQNPKGKIKVMPSPSLGSKVAVISVKRC